MDIFDQPDQDAAYLTWLVEHPQGYVLNAARTKQSGWSALHLSTCGTIHRDLANGQRWTTNPKVCSDDLASLKGWAATERPGRELRPCGTCQPPA